MGTCHNIGVPPEFVCLVGKGDQDKPNSAQADGLQAILFFLF